MRLLCLLTWLALAVVETTGAELPAKDLATARKTYVTKCAKCHRFYEPKDYSEQNWHRWMESMNRKSKLKPSQGDLLIRYLDIYRAGLLPGKPEDKPKEK